MNRTKLIIPGAAAIVLATVAVGVYIFLRPPGETGILEASGQVRGTEVTISSRLSGTLDIVAVREGQRIRSGELIAQISSKETEARLAQAKAQVNALENQVKEVDAQLKSLDSAQEQSRLGVNLTRDLSFHEAHRADEAVERVKAEIAAAEAQLDRDQKSYERYEKLLAQGFISQNYFDDIRTRRAASEARVTAAKRAGQEAQAMLQRARSASTEVRIKQQETERLVSERERLKAARAAISSQTDAARARVAETEATLADTRLIAPADGTVINKLAEPGELAAHGRPIATLVNLSDLYVRVYIPERDVGKIRLENPARIVADAFPGKPFSGKVTEVAQKAEFTPKEVHMKDEREKLVFGVKVAIDNPQGYLKPGMPVDVKIKWKDEAQW